MYSLALFLYYPVNNEPCMLQAKVLHQYKPQDKEELHLHPGDTITEVVELEDGWCRVSTLVISLWDYM